MNWDLRPVLAGSLGPVRQAKKAALIGADYF